MPYFYQLKLSDAKIGLRVRYSMTGTHYHEMATITDVERDIVFVLFDKVELRNRYRDDGWHHTPYNCFELDLDEN